MSGRSAAGAKVAKKVMKKLIQESCMCGKKKVSEGQLSGHDRLREGETCMTAF
jgi:hypothetical protein